MLQLFVPDNFQELAAFLRRAHRLRFPRDGSLRLTAQAATHEPNAAPAGGNGTGADDDSTSSDDDI